MSSVFWGFVTTELDGPMLLLPQVYCDRAITTELRPTPHIHINYSSLVALYSRFKLSFLPRPWLWNAPNTRQCWYVSAPKGATLLAARETYRHTVVTGANVYIGHAAA